MGGLQNKAPQGPMTMQSAINIFLHTGLFPNIIENVSLGFLWYLLSTFYTSAVFIHTIIAVKSVANTALRYHIAGVPLIILFTSTAYELNIFRHLSTSPINVFKLNQEFTHLLFDNSDSDEQQRNILK
jgi:hypothetical protein